MNGNTWLITLTDLRIIFLDKGIIYGLKQIAIPLDRINSITGSTGIIFGDIEIADGNTTHKISNVWKKTVNIFTSMTQEQIQKLKDNETGSTPKTTEASDPMAKLEKLAELMEKGILTSEEFAQQKAKILDS